jgi:asparagine synthase (glutamine-hydrolysing)
VCGISGIISLNATQVNEQSLLAMQNAIAHRGPDGKNHWLDDTKTVGLAHNRLAILDLSEAANQPMQYKEKYSIVYNGEIYNYLELKEELIELGYQFTTSSDTEVLLAAFDCYGQECLQKLDGMFAFCIVDNKKKRAFFARDRFGEKPLYYALVESNYLVFASEMKALWAYGIAKNPNHTMNYNYLVHGMIENPNDLSETFYQGIKKLPHAHCALLDFNTAKFKVQQYYELPVVQQQVNFSEADVLNEFTTLFKEALRLRLRSDVQVGTSLSGGIDSSLIVYGLHKLEVLPQGLKTFSAIFPGYAKDESKYIKQIASELPIEPFYVNPNAEQFASGFTKMMCHQEEPVANASVFAQYLVTKLAAKNNISVLIDGQGADEVFAGYNHFYATALLELKQNKNSETLYQTMLSGLQELVAQGVIPKGELNLLRNNYKVLMPGVSNAMRKYAKLLQAMRNTNFNTAYLLKYQGQTFNKPGTNKLLNEQLYTETFKYGLQQLLRYADRNSMAHGVEIRLPFLYHKLVEFAFSLPLEFKIRNTTTKWLLKNCGLLPEFIASRKDKVAYEPPQHQWLLQSTEQVQKSLINLQTAGIAANSRTSANKNFDWRILNLGTLSETWV